MSNFYTLLEQRTTLHTAEKTVKKGVLLRTRTTKKGGKHKAAAGVASVASNKKK